MVFKADNLKYHQMLIPKSNINIKDNSGIVLAQCTQVEKSKKNRKPCGVGGFLKATIKKGAIKSQTSRTIKGAPQKQRKLRGTDCLHDLAIIQTKKALRRLDGSMLRFNSNSGVLVNKTRLPIYRKVNAIVPMELKKRCSPLLSLARNVI